MEERTAGGRGKEIRKFRKCCVPDPLQRQHGELVILQGPHRYQVDECQQGAQEKNHVHHIQLVLRSLRMKTPWYGIHQPWFHSPNIATLGSSYPRSHDSTEGLPYPISCMVWLALRMEEMKTSAGPRSPSHWGPDFTNYKRVLKLITSSMVFTCTLP